MTGVRTRPFGRASLLCALALAGLGTTLAVPGLADADLPRYRTEHSQTRSLGDGVYETTLSSRPLNFRDGSGGWKAIDNDLRRRPDGTLQTQSNAVEVEIPQTADGDVRFAAGDESVSFSLAGADASTAEVDGEAATFDDVADDVDLAYEADGKVLKETLTLASSDAPAVYRFDVSSGGLRPQLSPAGDVAFVDGAGRRQLGFAAPWMRDAAGEVSRAARYEIEQAGGTEQVVLRLDAGWLEDGDRRFPVVVDPTVYSDLEHICEIRSGARSNTTYCDSAVTDTWVGRDPSGVVHRNLMDVGDLREVLPHHVQVLDAWYAPYLVGQNPVEPSDLDLHHLTTDFAPGATWTRFDGRTPWRRAGGDFDPQVIQRRSSDDAASDGWLGFDMTELAQRLVAGSEPSANLLLKAADETRTHVDAFGYAEVKVRWTHRTGVSPLYSYEDWSLSDGSTLRVNVANANFVLISDDIDLESDDGRFTVARYFNSLDSYTGDSDEALGTFGWGTRGDFGSITLQRQWLSGSYVFSGPGAETGVFIKRADGSFSPPPGMNAALTENLDGTKTIVFNDTTETWRFDASGRLIQTVQDWGYAIDGAYGPDGLASLRDTAGRSAAFGYDTAGRMRTITDHDLAVHRYDYDSLDRLIAYTSPTGATTSYAYDLHDRMTKLTMPDRSGLRISYYGGGHKPERFTPFDTAGVDQAATWFGGELEFGEFTRPATARRVYFFDPGTLVVDQVQEGDSAAVRTSGSIPDLDGRYTRGDTPFFVDVTASQARAGVQTTSLEVDDVVVDQLGDAPCDGQSCPHRSTTRLGYDPTFDADGTYEYGVEITDGDDLPTVVPDWEIRLDRTPPSTPPGVNFAGFEDDAETLAEFNVIVGADPEAPDRTPGSGYASTEVRHRVGTGAWTAWEQTITGEIQVPGTGYGQTVTFEARSADVLGNVSPVATHEVLIEEAPAQLHTPRHWELDENGRIIEQPWPEGEEEPGEGGVAPLAVRLPSGTHCYPGTVGVSAPYFPESDSNPYGRWPNAIISVTGRYICNDRYNRAGIKSAWVEVCIRMWLDSGPATQQCNRGEQDVDGWISHAIATTEIICRPGVQRYVVTVKGWPRQRHVHEQPTYEKYGPRRQTLGFSTLRCDNASAWRFFATHSREYRERTNPNGWRQVNFANEISSTGDVLRGVLGGPPTTTSRGWQAHHIIPTGRYDDSRDSSPAQAAAWACRFEPHSGANGVYLRGSGLASSTRAWQQLSRSRDPYRRALSRRGYHPAVHSTTYFDNLTSIIAPHGRGSTCDQDGFFDGLRAMKDNLLVGRGY